MKFLTVRDLRSKSAQIWKDLPKEQEMVITNNGRPVAILSSIDESNLEMSLNSIRRARMAEIVSSLQRESVRRGTDRMATDELDGEIKATRKAMKK